MSHEGEVREVKWALIVASESVKAGLKGDEVTPREG